jgi:hypothetical protein
MFMTEGTVLKSVGMGEMRARRELELSKVLVSAVGTELSKAMGSIRGRAH